MTNLTSNTSATANAFMPGKMPVTGLLCYCRSGYEQNLAQELEQVCAQAEVFGYAKVIPNSGYVFFSLYTSVALAEINPLIKFSEIMFARQLVWVFDYIQVLDRNDRLVQIQASCAAVMADDFLARTAVVESADTEDGKELAKFCRKFTVPLRQMLRQEDWLYQRKSKQAIAGLTVHAFFEHGSAVYLGVTLPGNRSAHENGIYRLKFPQDAPSRSTLKLEEAINTFLTPVQQTTLLHADATAVDLGACPGGWTYQLVQRKLHVEAVDNGAMDEALMATGYVTYASADGFKYKPQYGKVDWLVCDMIEQPNRVAVLMAQWLVEGWAQNTIFNLKLPMKQRFTAMQNARNEIESRLQTAGISFTWQAKHLYHNRDEVTVCILTER